MQTMGTEYASHGSPSAPLLQLLEQESMSLSNYKNEKFLSLNSIRQILTREEILAWANHHPLHEPSEHGVDSPQLVTVIRKRASLLFAILVLASLEHLTSRLISCGLNDALLFDQELFSKYCLKAELTEEQKQKLVEKRSCIGAVFVSWHHQDIPRSTVLPFLKRENLDRAGSYGTVYRVTLVAGHLAGYQNVRVLPHARIELAADAC